MAHDKIGRTVRVKRAKKTKAREVSVPEFKERIVIPVTITLDSLKRDNTKLSISRGTVGL